MIVPIPADRLSTIQATTFPLFNELSVVDGQAVSVWSRVTGTVGWFRADLFQRHGWQTPRTMDKFLALVDQISATTDLQPWCVGMSAGGATGWYLTDFVELFLLNEHGTAVYDDWAANRVRFDDPRVVQLLERLSAWFTNPDVVSGDADAMLTRSVEGGFHELASEEANWGCSNAGSRGYRRGPWSRT